MCKAMQEATLPGGNAEWRSPVRLTSEILASAIITIRFHSNNTKNTLLYLNLLHMIKQCNGDQNVY